MNSKEYFETVADKWDRLSRNFFNETLREKAIVEAGIKSGKVAADIGAGTGFLSEAIINKGVRVIAVDKSIAMLKKLKSKLGKSGLVECRLGEAEKLPLAANEVDYVLANMYLHHVERPAVAVKEMARILKPGGKLVITDMDAHNIQFLKEEHHDRWPGFRREEVKRWFIEAGLKKVKVGCVGESCCAKSEKGEKASISLFIASGEK